MKKFYKQSLLLLMAFFMAGAVNAQSQLPKIDIGLFLKDANTLQVKARPNGNFEGIISNLQFTLSWDASQNVTLGAPNMTLPGFSAIPVTKAGIEVEANGIRYQKFTGTGITPLKNMGASWNANAEIVVLEIPVTAASSGILQGVEISTDAKTTDRMFNGVFYAELNSVDRTGDIYSTTNLPVEYLSFTGKKINAHDVQLDWVTASENNNDYFVIEKKRDQGDFEAIGKVTGAGTSVEENRYTYLDQSGMSNVNFYRLKQVDFDGTASYSNVVEINFDVFHNDKFQVYPTPAGDHVYLQATGKLDADYNFTISDLSGKEIFKGVLVEEAPESKIKIDLSDYAAGTYYIKTESPAGKSYLNRILKADK